MKRLSAILVTTSLFAGHALPQRLEVFLNTNDCFNCIASISQLQDLSLTIPIKIVCDENKKGFIPSLLAQNGISTWANLIIEYIPAETFRLITPVSSICKWMPGDSSTFTFDLREIAAHRAEIVRTGRTYDRTNRTPLVKDRALGDRLTIYPLEDRILVVDYLFRKSYLISLDKSDSVRLAEFKLSESLTRQSIARVEGDLRICDSLSSLDPSSPQFTHEILAVNELGNEFEFVDAIHYMSLFPDGSPIQTAELVYFKCSKGVVSPSLYGTWQDIEPYLIVLNFGFELNDTALTTSVIRKEVNEDPLYLLADWKREGDSISFGKYRPLICPVALHRYVNNHSGAVFGLIRNGYYVTTVYPLIYSLKTNNTLELGSLIAPNQRDWFVSGRPSYTTWDVLPCGNDQVMVLYSIGDKTELAWVDVHKRQLLRRQTIGTDKIDVSTIRILSDGRLVAFSKSYDALVFWE